MTRLAVLSTGQQLGGAAIGIAFVLIVIYGGFLSSRINPADLAQFQDGASLFDKAREPDVWKYFYRPLQEGGTIVRPFYVLSIRLTETVLGTSAFAHHVTSLGFVWINAVLVFAVSRRLAGAETAALATALFATHYVNRGDVFFVNNQGGVLISIAVLAALLAFMRGIEDGRRRWTALAIASLTLGFFAEESAVVFPLLAAAYMRIFRSASWRTVLLTTAPYWVLDVVLLGYRAWVLGEVVGGYSSQLQGLGPGELVIVAVVNWTNGVFNDFWVWTFPNPLSLEGRWRESRLFAGSLGQGFSDVPKLIRLGLRFVVELSVAALALVTTAAVAMRLGRDERRRLVPLVCFSVVWIIVNTLPFFAQGGPRYSTLPSQGAALVVAACVLAAARHRADPRVVWWYRACLTAVLILVVHSIFRILSAPEYLDINLGGFLGH